ncbi:CRISPR-associated endonuclease Cas2 [Virgibacillus pantothenticus]|nr:CRISPR-associated endonuclease Cas2 [Virgibacillus pantothenticus]MBU8565669.1 CRISPR-associated endonuclease Cas2 [Virgibacillus pantothenticus]MBU8601248.1 CRISPR-associated endonuclease Cas2 [Virgibacillus pantothenticus]MBU8635598.1 CRISPR-associated endonuclease Cas2 [Virgibacillus pantothenticus]MBU8643291.1 CRISPR-associated endonuclease Cas2 [Virgibacillus pantothenticus]MBU8647461.1 CRISPR-associated endonuclease Cas2 [Virgibacillus pantothenticus]
MRIIVFFDLPVVLKKERKAYSQFRKFLLNDGYVMLQYSVYSRICNGEDGVRKHMKRLRENLPPVNGAIRAMKITEKQFENMEILLGTTVVEEELGAKKIDFF